MAVVRGRTPSVMLVTGAYFPERSSGGLQSQAMLRVLRNRVDARVLTTSTNRALPAHDTVEDVPVSRVWIDIKSPVARLRATVRMLVDLLRHIPKVDLVHVQGYSSKNILVSLSAKAFRRPIVLHLQTARHDEPDTIRAMGRLAWWAYSSADLYLSVSPGLTERYLSAGLPAGRVREIPNGVDTSRFSLASPDERVALRRQLNLPLERPLILFVGVMSPDKQPDVLLEAWTALQRDPATATILVFVGATDPQLYELGGRLAERLSDDVQKSGVGDRVIFAPPTNDIQHYFRAADVFALPSAREGLPIALLEAMACGLPCVASRLPGSTDVIIDHGVNGRLAPPGDARALAAELAAVLTDPLAATHMGVAARRTVEARYAIERVAERWLSAYQDVLAAS